MNIKTPWKSDKTGTQRGVVCHSFQSEGFGHWAGGTRLVRIAKVIWEEAEVWEAPRIIPLTPRRKKNLVSRRRRNNLAEPSSGITIRATFRKDDIFFFPEAELESVIDCLLSSSIVRCLPASSFFFIPFHSPFRYLFALLGIDLGWN